MVDRMWSGTMRILSSFLSSLPGQPDALRSGNFPNLGNSAENWQSLPSDAWNDASYRSRFTGENNSCWPDESHHPQGYIPSPYPSGERTCSLTHFASTSEVAAFLLPRPQRRCCCADRLLGGAICSWSNPQVIEDLMFFGECFGNRSRYTDPALSGPGHPRPSPRAPIVAERLWAGAAQKPQAVLEAVVRTILRPTARAFHLLLAVPASELLFQS